MIVEVVGWPPCIRIIITESKACSSLIGKLFLITCPGGSIGRSTNRDVVIPDDNVSKVRNDKLCFVIFYVIIYNITQF